MICRETRCPRSESQENGYIGRANHLPCCKAPVVSSNSVLDIANTRITEPLPNHLAAEPTTREKVLPATSGAPSTEIGGLHGKTFGKSAGGLLRLQPHMSCATDTKA